MKGQHTVHEAKTHLSKLLERVEAGEEIVIARGPNPIARIVPFQASSGKRDMSGWLPPISLDRGFDDPLPEDELRLWNGEGD